MTSVPMTVCGALQYLFNAPEGFPRLVLEHKCRPSAKLQAVFATTCQQQSLVSSNGPNSRPSLLVNANIIHLQSKRAFVKLFRCKCSSKAAAKPLSSSLSTTTNQCCLHRPCSWLAGTTAAVQTAALAQLLKCMPFGGQIPCPS